jgi:HTH-type transcriptional regulator/antitoxin HigA
MQPLDAKTPGQLIAALLRERSWDKQILAAILGIDNAGVSRLISDKKRVDAETAIVLSEIFGIEAERFMDLQQAYDLARARMFVTPDEGRASRAALFAQLPIAEMMTRGWLRRIPISDTAAVESEVARFFGVNMQENQQILRYAAKKTGRKLTPPQLAWIYRVKEVARGVLVPKYSRAKVLQAIEKLQPLLISPEAVRHVPRILAEAGVRFVIVESLKSAKIEGVCCWLDDTSPVIGMSLRLDRIDNFWFVLRHELEHVLQSHGSGVFLDYELEGERAGSGLSIPEEERIANAAAANFCVPNEAIESFIARKNPVFSERDFVGFSRRNLINPGIVAGQLQHRTNRYELFRKYLVKTKAHILPTALADGWGTVAPVVT